MKEKVFTLGVAPTRRDTKDFELRFAHENNREVRKIMERIAREMPMLRILNIDWLNEEGLLINPSDAEKVARYFREENVDAVFVPHMNFGSEDAVVTLARMLRKPVLLWGPRDQHPPASGPRQTDTQCGLFATSAMLARNHIPFHYIPNCWLDDPRIDIEIKRFIRMANTAKAFFNMRIGQFSLRPRTFSTMKINENDLLERFGIEVIPVDTLEIFDELKKVKDTEEEWIASDVRQTQSRYDTDAVTTETICNMALMKKAVLNIAGKYQLNAIASECWKTYRAPLGIAPCGVFGQLIEMGLPVACEGDIYGAISSRLLDAAALWETPHFLADITMRHPLNDNAELLWHCGPFPASLAKPGKKPCLVDGRGYFEMKEGTITLTRFAERDGKYLLFADEGRQCKGPATNGGYVWMETDDWEAWERKLIEGPYVHHISGAYGHYAGILRDACKFLNGVCPDKV